MTCASCVGRVERALARGAGRAGGAGEPGDRARPAARRWPGRAEAALGAALARAGYRLASADRGARRRPRRGARDARPAARGAAHRALPGRHGRHGARAATGCRAAGGRLALATPVVFGLGARFWRAGWAGAARGQRQHGPAGGDRHRRRLGRCRLVPAAAPWRRTTPHALYFEAAAVVVFFVLLGKWLEARARRATGRGDPRPARPRAPHRAADRGRARRTTCPPPRWRSATRWWCARASASRPMAWCARAAPASMKAR